MLSYFMRPQRFLAAQRFIILLFGIIHSGGNIIATLIEKNSIRAGGLNFSFLLLILATTADRLLPHVYRLLNNSQYNFMSKVRKVYQLRKLTAKGSTPPIQSNSLTPPKQFQKPQSSHFHPKTIEQPLLQGCEIVLDRFRLLLVGKLGKIATQNIVARNIGNSAVYFEWEFKKRSPINSHAVKDPKQMFFCHYQPGVILPGEEIVFSFSFLPEIPGYFTQECEMKVHPPLITHIPIVKLEGQAYIEDQWANDRANFLKQVEEDVRAAEIGEIVDDIIQQVKIPPPPLPDVSNPQVAEREFELKNNHLNLYFRPIVHKWLFELFEEIWQQSGRDKKLMYWNQSIEAIQCLINQSPVLDEVQKICFTDRLNHYSYLCTISPPNKSPLYRIIRSFIENAAYNLGGMHADAVKKELDMWEIPFRQPLEEDTPQMLQKRKEENDKIKSEWVKRTKKKKWGQEEERQMLSQLRNRLGSKVTQDILEAFSGFQEKAAYVKAVSAMNCSKNYVQYFEFLQRMKTVKEYPIEGKKVLLKFHLKLKSGCEDKVKQLQEYLGKKKEFEKKLEEEKKQENKKKSKPKPKSKKNSKDEESEKPPSFDFMSILDEESWQGFTQTFRLVLEKSPFLVLLGCSYGPRLGAPLEEYSIRFLLEYLQTIEPSIEFMAHQDLKNLEKDIQEENVNEGTIYMLQNLNFLPYQILKEPSTAEEGASQTGMRQLIFDQIQTALKTWSNCIDVVVTQDRFQLKASGITSYLHRQCILGTQWWKYIVTTTQLMGAHCVFGGYFSPQNLLFIHRLLSVCERVYVMGEMGLKLHMASKDIDSMGQFTLSQQQKQSIKTMLGLQDHSTLSQKLYIAQDYAIQINEENEQQKITDVGPKTLSTIKAIQRGRLFVINTPAILKQSQQSLITLAQHLHAQQELKKARHAVQVSTPAGINYDEDLVSYIIGIDKAILKSLQLKPKPQKSPNLLQENQEGQQQLGEEEIEEEQEEQMEIEEEGKGKIQQIAQYYLRSEGCIVHLVSEQFIYGLKDISLYPKQEIV